MAHPLRIRAFVTTALAALFSACGPPINTQVIARPASSRESKISSQILAAVNGYRQRSSRAPLQGNRALDQMAQNHSEFMRANRGKFGIYGADVSHYGVEQRALAAREMYGMDQFGENVAAATDQGSTTAAYLLDLWVKSPPHEHNLRNSWTSSGVGVVIDSDGTVFATQVFGSRSIKPSQMSMLNRLRVH
ncbi:MAG: CAP domain-containing protein [Akkermansiaceae bacterium]|nr:CAP domain-containing protein [Akkermansiaceae bacterium]MCF7731485.1 CAP domain-containing protein [Akkermansiaceae bacterium]